jgi:cytochrome c-type biogenesis protein CcmH
MIKYYCHCEERSDEAIAARLLRFARNDIFVLLVATIVWLIGMVTPAYAVRPDEMLPNPALEARSEQVGHELRCLVCRNQSIEDSEADLAHDLRLLVRQRIAAGDSDAQVVAYIRSRYGDFVLLRPPFESTTALLWAGPALILLLGGIAVFGFYRRRRHDAPPAAPLSAEEQQRVTAALETSPR